MTSSRSIPTRRISFEPSLHDLPRHFAGDGDLVMSHVIVALSSVFPDGEDYFVRSVRHYRDQITDPELKRAVSGFIGQESVHGREHRVLNDRFEELGYWSKRFERLTQKGLAVRERIFTPQSNLAATAALEHFTATLAEKLLTDPEARRPRRRSRGAEVVPVARARGVRAQGRRLRRVPSRRWEASGSASRPCGSSWWRSSAGCRCRRSSRCSPTAPPTGGSSCGRASAG